MKYIKECKFLLGALLATGQIVLFKLGFNKNSISTIKLIDGSYLNDLILSPEIGIQDQPTAKKLYPFCYSYYICEPCEREDKTRVMFVMAHFNSGIYIFGIEGSAPKIR